MSIRYELIATDNVCLRAPVCLCAGDTGTIDDNLPAVPMFLWRQPELINAMLRPLNMYNADDLHRPDGAPYPMNVSWPGEQPVSGTR